MSDPDVIYGSADVAKMLGVTRSAIGNYRRRHQDTPAPRYVTPEGRDFWSGEGMAAWLEWHASRGTLESTARSSRVTETIQALREDLKK